MFRYCDINQDASRHVEVTALYDTAFLVVVTVVYWLICRRRSPDRLIGTAMILTDIGYMAYIILR